MNARTVPDSRGTSPAMTNTNRNERIYVDGQLTRPLRCDPRGR